jgi:glycosyltransferase involved in cell wall biosynthesis
MFLFVGRINLMKNILFIADALKILKDKGFDYKMVYVGAGGDMEKLETHIKQLGIEDNVVLAGKIMDRVLLSKIYAAADLNLFPSVYDTDGLVKYEGASQHTPTVLMEGISAAKGIEDGVTGYISEANAESFAEKIIEALSDKEKYNKVCKNVHTHLYKTWPQRVKEAYDRYLYLIAESESQAAQTDIFLEE